MGLLSDLSKSSPIKKVRVVGFKKNGHVTVRMNNVDYSLSKPSNLSFKKGETVVITKTENGQYCIVGKTEGLYEYNNIKEVFRYG